MKKMYQDPELQVVLLGKADIITDSIDPDNPFPIDDNP